MEKRTIQILEFDRVRAALANETTFSGGQELAESLEPTANPIWIEESQRETAEALAILNRAEDPPFGGLRDIRPYVVRAQMRSLLQPQELLDIAYTVSGARKLAAFVRQKSDADSVLRDIASDMGVHNDLEREIERCIGPDATLRDQASATLAKVRTAIRTLQGRIRNKTESVLREADARRYLQDAIITVRAGRYVLPVKQEHKSGVPGIVHDQSSSGATLFIEPLAVVEMGNQLRTHLAEEEAEIERILADLTAAVQAEGVGLRQTVHAAARLDLSFAKARLAIRWDCIRPHIADERWIDIKQGRHPLLPADTVVPIDVWLGREAPALVITGPNTGGKTVTLKTVGLFVLMAQAGLHVPAETGTQLPLCDAVYADIGDEQSIEQSLSTFSSHMTHIVDILRVVGPKSLVLLDELGAGTDPTEGAALAMALLDHLIQTACLTIATTHYSELKSFAYTESGVNNASVEFDVATLRPTYRLSIGVAGSSNAFAISGKLGLPSSIIERAKQRLTAEEQKVEDLIRGVETDRRRAEQERSRAEQLRATIEAERVKFDEERERFHAKKEGILNEVRAEAASLLRAARIEAEALIGELRRRGAQADVEDARAARQLLHEMEEQISQSQPSGAAPSARSLSPSQLHPGMTVHIVSLGRAGEVLGVPDSGGQVRVQIGTMKATVSVSDLERTEQVTTRTVPPQKPVMSGSTLRSKTMRIQTELDLRGLTVSEAVDSVEKYLDEVLLASLPTVRLIHGKGTGALRKAVQDYLQGHPHVQGFRLGEPGEGGAGVTVVEM